MASVDLNRLDIEPLTELLGNAQAEMTARDKQSCGPRSGAPPRGTPQASAPRSTANRRTPTSAREHAQSRSLAAGSTRSTSIRSPWTSSSVKARQVRDLRREWAPRVVAVHVRLVVEDLDDPAIEGVREGQHRKLDEGRT